MEGAEHRSPAIEDLLDELKTRKEQVRALFDSIEACEDKLRHFPAETVTNGRISIKELSGDLESTIAALSELRAKVDVGLSVSSSSPLQQNVSKWPLSSSEYRRYARQLVLPEVGIAGQVRLKQSSALIIGAGGLGCPAAAYLAGSGVGTIGVVDGDVVEESNLHRQILHDTTKVGVLKVDSVIEAMRKINPLSNYIAHRAHLTPETAIDVLSSYDVILDCTDNPATRYLVSDACVLLGKPLVSASALRTDGQLSVLNYPPAPPGQTINVTKLSNDGLSSSQTEVTGGGPCYRCIWPIPPPPSAVQTCGEGGILGPVVGTMGVLQALEAIKILSAPQPVAPHPSQMLLFSSYPSLSFRSVRLRPRKANCAACSASATITKESLMSGSLDYVAFCGGLAGEVEMLPSTERLMPKELLQAHQNGGRLEVTSTSHEHGEASTAASGTSKLPLIVDIREKPLYDIFHIHDSINIPYSHLSNIRDKTELPELLLSRQVGDPTRKTLLICARGNDSQYGALKLRGLLEDLEHDGTRLAVKSHITDVAGGWAALRKELGVSKTDWPDV